VPETVPRAGIEVPPASGRSGLFGLPWIALLLLAGLALRLIVVYVLGPGEGFRDDLRMFQDWARTMSLDGPGGFYRNALPPGESPGFLYTPGYLYVLWVVGAIGDAIATATGRSPAEVVAALIKVPAIVADLLVALVLYRAATRWWGVRAGLASAALFLFLPVTWYDSAIWGQVDAVGSLILLGSLLLLIAGWSELAMALAVLAAVTKPQYAVGLLVVGAVLVGRHLLRSGSGPVPAMGPRLAAIDRRLGGLMTARQGPIRLLSSALIGLLVFVAVVLPFDLPSLASDRFAGLPIVGHVAGFLTLIRSSGTYYPNLTVNAFNPWALVGPTPLTQGIGQGDILTTDSLQVLGPLPASLVGAILFGLVALTVIGTLVLRDDRSAILVGFTVLALAFFILPTRVHERYLFPAIVTGSLLAAASMSWRWWVIALGVAQAANIHALITLPTYGTSGIQSLPLGSAFREPSVVALIVVIQTAAFIWALWVFVRRTTYPALRREPVLVGPAYQGPSDGP
jgi:hypothetical protein